MLSSASRSLPRYTCPDVISRVTTWPCEAVSCDLVLLCPRILSATIVFQMCVLLRNTHRHLHDIERPRLDSHPAHSSVTYLRLVEQLDRNANSARHICGTLCLARRNSIVWELKSSFVRYLKNPNWREQSVVVVVAIAGNLHKSLNFGALKGCHFAHQPRGARLPLAR
jgi:hypothetical protein